MASGITGGFSGTGTLAVDMSGAMSPCPDVEGVNANIWAGVAVTLDGKPVVCGGPGNMHSCWELTPTGLPGKITWLPLGALMEHGRENAAAVQLSENTFVVAGMNKLTVY